MWEITFMVPSNLNIYKSIKIQRLLWKTRAGQKLKVFLKSSVDVSEGHNWWKRNYWNMGKIISIILHVQAFNNQKILKHFTVKWWGAYANILRHTAHIPEATQIIKSKAWFIKLSKANYEFISHLHYAKLSWKHFMQRSVSNKDLFPVLIFISKSRTHRG